MPKLRKEKEDEIIKLLKEGYTIAEVMEKTGTSRGPVSRINKEIKAEEELSESPIQSIGSGLLSLIHI